MESGEIKNQTDFNKIDDNASTSVWGGSFFSSIQFIAKLALNILLISTTLFNIHSDAGQLKLIGKFNGIKEYDAKVKSFIV